VRCLRYSAVARSVSSNAIGYGGLLGSFGAGGVLGALILQPALASLFIFTTGDIANEETEATLSGTGAPCVEKPFSVQQLISVVEKTMGKAAIRLTRLTG
jgi:hypothetical protein